MKIKKLLGLLLLPVVLSAAGCSSEPGNTVSDIPTLTVVCGESTVDAEKTTYSIDIGSMEVQADGQHPLSIGYEDCLETMSDDSIELRFSSTPNSVSVRRWKDIYAGDETSYEANYVNLETDGILLDASEEGYYIYEVTAEWDNAEAHYGFRAGGVRDR